MRREGNAAGPARVLLCSAGARRGANPRPNVTVEGRAQPTLENRLSAHAPPDEDPKRSRADEGQDAGEAGRSGAADLARFLQKRKLAAYEEGMARLAYAYGVDLRRARWLTDSSVGNALVRAVDRRWPVLSRDLVERGELDVPDHAPTSLLREVADCMQLLRSPLPVVRLVGKPGANDDESIRWPLAVGLGPTHGDVNWLVLDVEGLMDLDVGLRQFFIGAALADLQCDHGVFVTAHLLASRRDGDLSARLLRTTLRPWSQVMAFTADRAGLLCAPDLETATTGMERQQALRNTQGRAWLPPLPTLEERKRALSEFDKTKVVARIRAARARAVGQVPSLVAPPSGDREGPSDGELGVPDDAWSLARVDTRLTRRLGLF